MSKEEKQAVLDILVGGSYGSRKFLLALVALLLVVGLGVLAAWSPGINAALPTVVGGVLGVLAAYYTGNVANKAVAARALAANEAGKTVATKILKVGEVSKTEVTETTQKADPEGEDA